ncbi:uncharacterized protein ACA1_065140 [Acanthamoeba castellanii str. Neff]|uniref:Uncharacterized protein n=1 Tax=Acanthamoeba castellanii (strain ATCC 30010 / Neff) TaxID=1257118 RepID=L8H024_ACACF|nr:uncharacterized protein ACA1_065140 [Acanthamoeba castellanii str. Neff]ELR17726.1 hypothetical protein ACA1_065140 [Acanthamoeba castellanii str. Neff]
MTLTTSAGRGAYVACLVAAIGGLLACLALPATAQSCPGDGIKVYGTQSFPDDSSAWVAVSNVDATSNANQLWLSEKFAYVFSFNTIFYSFSLLQRTAIPPSLATNVAVSPMFKQGFSPTGPVVVLVPRSTPWNLVEVVITADGYVLSRNLTIPQFAQTVQWQKIIPNTYGLTSKLYLFSADHLVIVNYNALTWSIDAVVAIPAGQYPTQVIRSAMVNAANQQELFVTRANEDPEKPGEVSVLLLSADDGSLVNRVILDHSPAVMFVTSGSDGTNDIIWAESGALFDSQQSTGAAFIWSLDSHELSYAEIPVSSSQTFGSAYGSTPNNKYILLGFGEPAGQEYTLASVNLQNSCVIDLQKQMPGTPPEAGNEVGGILSQAGLVLFGNHNQQGFNQVTLIYYANWI